MAVRVEWDRMEGISIKSRARVVTCLLAAFYGVLLAGCSGSGYAPVSDRSLGGRSYDSGPPVASAVTESDATEHRVVGGDTLYAIAWRYGKDFRDLARFNNIGADYIIYPGQRLTLTPPQALTPAEPAESRANQPRPPNSGLASAKPAAGLPSGSSQSSGAGSSTASTTVSTTVSTAAASTTSTTVSAVASPTRVGSQPVTAKPPTRSQEAVGKARTPAAPIAIPPPSSVAKARPVKAQPESGAALVWSWPAKGDILKRFSPRGRLANGLDIAGRRGEPVLAAADGKVVYVGSGILGYGQLIIINHNEEYLSAYAHNSRLLVKERDAVTLGDKIAEIGHSGTTRSMLHFEIRKDGKPVDPLRYLPKR